MSSIIYWKPLYFSSFFLFLSRSSSFLVRREHSSLHVIVTISVAYCIHFSNICLFMLTSMLSLFCFNSCTTFNKISYLLSKISHLTLTGSGSNTKQSKSPPWSDNPGVSFLPLVVSIFVEFGLLYFTSKTIII